MAIDIQLICEPGASKSTLSIIADKWQLKHTPTALMALVLTSKYLQLKKINEPKLGGIYVDFISGMMKHRRKFGGGRNEAIAKAAGIKKSYLPAIVDATAGLGRDAFILAALGCEIRMYERHAVVAALLYDGLQRGYANAEIGSWLRQRMILIHASSIDSLTTLSPAPNVVYIDPMYPHRQKSALVKKEMLVFQTLVGNDEDADSLLIPAMTIAKRRVIVKRPNYASPLAAIPPQAMIKTKNHRFDIYSVLT
ncbi:MAG: 16S rRNA (guanine(1516)-N(2))-methyltransferase RsmJ [Arsenophonus sp.]